MKNDNEKKIVFEKRITNVKKLVSLVFFSTKKGNWKQYKCLWTMLFM